MEQDGGHRDGEEERSNSTGGELSRYEQTSPEDPFWDFTVNILGTKEAIPIHFCEKCKLPIKIYGRMLPCKHAFCYDCAVLEGKGNKVCPGCGNRVKRIQKHAQGFRFKCISVEECRRTYLSQRDLEAHINFHHMRA